MFTSSWAILSSAKGLQTLLEWIISLQFIVLCTIHAVWYSTFKKQTYHHISRDHVPCLHNPWATVPRSWHFKLPAFVKFLLPFNIQSFHSSLMLDLNSLFKHTSRGWRTEVVSPGITAWRLFLPFPFDKIKLSWLTHNMSHTSSEFGFSNQVFWTKVLLTTPLKWAHQPSFSAAPWLTIHLVVLPSA